MGSQNHSASFSSPDRDAPTTRGIYSKAYWRRQHAETYTQADLAWFRAPVTPAQGVL